VAIICFLARNAPLKGSGVVFHQDSIYAPITWVLTPDFFSSCFALLFGEGTMISNLFILWEKWDVDIGVWQEVAMDSLM
jgi:hypothetical protein